jgi:hypothetical protein
MGIAGYVSVCVSLTVLVFTVSLHVLAYMAIFMCVGYIIFTKKRQKKTAKQNPSSI